MAIAHAPHAPPVVLPDGEIRPSGRVPARERWSWALYDFANTMFSMNVGSLFFTVWFVSDLGGTNTQLAVATSAASLLVVLSIPMLGAVSDARRRRLPWVLGFTVAAVVATALIGVLGQATLPRVGEHVVGGAPAGSVALGLGALLPLLVVFAVANYAYQGAQPFYNAMLPELAPPSQQGRLSGLGAALGYVGSITGVLTGMVFFAGGIPGIVQLPGGVVEAIRGLVPFSAGGGRVSVFVPTALLFLLFSLPLFVFCRDHAPAPTGEPVRIRRVFAELATTLRETKRHPGALRFIVASLLYQDAIGTIIYVMAVYAVEAMGFAEGFEATLFVLLTVPAVIGSYALGAVCDHRGPKWTLQFVIGAWILLLLAMIVAPTRAAFLGVGVGIGLIFGGIATAERPMLLSLIPDAEAGRFFSLMVLSARAAAVIGPLVWALTVDGLMPYTGAPVAYRAGVVSLMLAMIGALWLLRGVPDVRERRGDGGTPVHEAPRDVVRRRAT